MDCRSSERRFEETMTYKKLMFLFLFTLPLLTSCYDKIELEQQSYVVALGIDKGEDEGSYTFSFQIANPEVGSTMATAGSSEEPEETVSILGSDIITATSLANSFVTKKIMLDHMKIIVVSEEVARSEDFIRVIQSASRIPQIRGSVQIIVSKEGASQFLEKNKPTMETRPHKYFQYMLQRAQQTGIIPDADIHRFFQITEGDADLFLAIYATTTKEENKTNKKGDHDYLAGQIPKQGGNPTQFMGSAVFKEGMMIDTLTGEDTRLCNILDKTVDMDELFMSFPDPVKPTYQVGFNYAQSSEPKVSIDSDNKANHASIDVVVPFELEIIAIPSMVDYALNQDDQNQLIQKFERTIEAKTNQLITKSQETYGSDPFYWSLYIRKFFKDVPAYEKGDWNKKIYPNAAIHVDYQLKRLTFGKMINDSKIDEVRD